MESYTYIEIQDEKHQEKKPEKKNHSLEQSSTVQEHKYPSTWAGRICWVESLYYWPSA